jgi:hypothetical protein
MQDVNWETLDPTGKMTVNQRRALVDEFGTEALIARHLGVDLAAAVEADSKKKAAEPGVIDRGLAWVKDKVAGKADSKTGPTGVDKSNPDLIAYAKEIKRRKPEMSEQEIWAFIESQTSGGY